VEAEFLRDALAIEAGASDEEPDGAIQGRE
jgi:hypothetical protein